MRDRLQKGMHILLKVGHGLLLFAGLNVLVLIFVCLLLWQRGVLTEERVQMCRKVFRGELKDEPKPKEREPEEIARVLRDYEDQTEEHLAREREGLEALRHRIALLQEENERMRREMEKERSTVLAERAAFEEFQRITAERESSETFRRSVDVLTKMDVAEAAQWLAALPDIKEMAVYLRSMRGRNMATILPELYRVLETEQTTPPRDVALKQYLLRMTPLLPPK